MVAALRERGRRAGADERGYSLPELIVATMVALIVAAAGMTVVMIAVRSEPKVSERAAQIQQGRTMIERISRELRQGESVSSPSASGLTMLTYVASASCGGAPSSTAILCRVTYACGSTGCTRTERNPNGSGSAPSEQVVSGILGPSVFSYQPSASAPEYVGLALSYPGEDGEETVTLADGVALRNYFPGGTQ